MRGHDAIRPRRVRAVANEDPQATSGSLYLPDGVMVAHGPLEAGV